MNSGQKCFGRTADGKPFELFTLSNGNGMRVALTNQGAAVVSIIVPDRRGQPADVVLGYERPADYAHNPHYFGATVGRCANRIAGSKFRLAGREYRLTANEGENHLHGGRRGFSRVRWEPRPFPAGGGGGVEFRYLSGDGEEGYPGTLEVSATFRLKEENALQIDYRAATDRDTIVNLTNHSYFNLSGAPRGDICGHRLQIHADRFAPVNAHLIPEGGLWPVDATPFDFRQPRSIGEGLGQPHPQLRCAGGYDHNWVLNRPDDTLMLAAAVHEPVSGRVLEVFTTAPGIQFYSGNRLGAAPPGKGGVRYGRHSGLCLETQHFPDTPHRPEFPPVLLRRGEIYRQQTIFRFTIR
jgi:aldose 1-epimerase